MYVCIHLYVYIHLTRSWYQTTRRLQYSLHRCQKLTFRKISVLYLTWTPTPVVCHTDMNASLLPHTDVSVHPITSPPVPVPTLTPTGINIPTCGAGMWLCRPLSPVKERQTREIMQDQSWLPVTWTMLFHLALRSTQLKRTQLSQQYVNCMHYRRGFYMLQIY